MSESANGPIPPASRGPGLVVLIVAGVVMLVLALVAGIFLVAAGVIFSEGSSVDPGIKSRF